MTGRRTTRASPAPGSRSSLPPTTEAYRLGSGFRLAHGSVLLITFSFGLACGANGQLDRQIDQVSRALAEVEARGALRCAPRELAISRSHLEFARLEREQGFPARARQHLEVADENVRAASVLTPAERCALR